MKIDAIISDLSPRRYHGIVIESSGRERVIWECGCQHRFRHTALECARVRRGLGERTLECIWNRVHDGHGHD